MRKITYVPIFFFIFLTINLFSKESSFNPFTGKIIGNKVRVRATPALDSEIICQLDKETLVLIVGEKNDFYAIKPFENTKVYVYRSYIIDNIVEANRVNVRLKPNLHSTILSQLQNKQKIDGTIYKKNNKWYEINPPESVLFYIAKNYITRKSDSTYYFLMQDRKEEASKLLNSAFFLTQAECKKPFNEMDTKKAISQFEAIIKGYSDFPKHVKQAKEGLALLQDNYLQKKIVYLETKANIAPEEKEQLFQDVATFKPTQSSNNTHNLEAFYSKNIFSEKNISEKMKKWLPAEKELYSSWATFHPNKSINTFYEEQKADSIIISGVVESFDKSIKNKPGNYLLKGKNIPLAYIYSIFVDLEKHVGKKISISVSPRPNNNFAFPAYFVNSIK